jgi:DNA invertase Pin-like site-specific DNA recombinase
MKTAIGYIRVSSEEQADSGLGLEAQRERIKAFCTLKGLELTGVFEDAAVSGGKPLERRPSGSKLLSTARKSKAVVIVAKLDRLFRSVADAASIIDDFDKKDIQLVAIAEGFDMTNPYGRAMAQMASVFAELERAMIAERTRGAMNVKRTRQERISGREPYGFTFGADGKLVRVDAEHAIIAEMKQLRAEGLSYGRIAEHLDSVGIRPKLAEKWSAAAVRQILNRAA